MTISEGAPLATAPPGREGALWAAARDGDREAFTELYHRHADAVWRHAHRLTGSPTAAEDVLAATFLTTWRRRAEVQLAGDSLRAWLLAVAGNEARTEWRRTHRRYRLLRRVGPAPHVDDHSDAVVASLDDRRRAHQVLAAVAELPAAQREAVALCLVADVPYAEAAQVLGVPEATLRSRIHRARMASEWRVADVLQLPRDLLQPDHEPGIALAIDDTFACRPDRHYVFVSTIGGTPAGSIQVAKLTGEHLVLFNPQRLEVEVGSEDGSTTSSAAAVQVIHNSPYAQHGRPHGSSCPVRTTGRCPKPVTSRSGCRTSHCPIPDRRRVRCWSTASGSSSGPWNTERANREGRS